MKSTDKEKGFLRGFIEFLLVIIIILAVVIKVDDDSKKKQEDAVKLPGRYLITMRWPQVNDPYKNDDVDAHTVHIESGEHAWYASPSSVKSYITMDSVDDTGGNMMFYTDIQTGELVPCSNHEERIAINTTVQGEFAVVAYMYNKRWSGAPTKVTVTLIDLLKGSQELIKEEVELLYIGQQKVAFRFSLNEVGDIVPGSKNQKPYLIEKTKRY
jgi:hypothetical protein